MNFIKLLKWSSLGSLGIAGPVVGYVFLNRTSVEWNNDYSLDRIPDDIPLKLITDEKLKTLEESAKCMAQYNNLLYVVQENTDQYTGAVNETEDFKQKINQMPLCDQHKSWRPGYQGTEAS